MIETSSEQINEQNHNHDHDPITSKNQIKKSNRETGSNFFCFSTYLISFPPSGNYFIIAIYFHNEVQKY